MNWNKGQNRKERDIRYPCTDSPKRKSEKAETKKDCDKCGNPVGTKYDAYDNPIYGDGVEKI